MVIIYGPRWKKLFFGYRRCFGLHRKSTTLRASGPGIARFPLLRPQATQGANIYNIKFLIYILSTTYWS